MYIDIYIYMYVYIFIYIYIYIYAFLSVLNYYLTVTGKGQYSRSGG